MCSLRRVQLCGLCGLDPLLAVEDVLVLIESDQVVAGHGREPDVAGLVLQHLVADGLRLLLPALTQHHIAKLDLDDAHLLLDLVLPALPGGLLGAGEGLLRGGPIANTVVVTPGVVSLLVALHGVHSPGRVSQLRRHGGHFGSPLLVIADIRGS